MDIYLEKRKDIYSDKEKRIYLDVAFTNDGNTLMIGCINHGYINYSIENNQYKVSPVILKDFFDMHVLHSVKVNYQNEGIYSFEKDNQVLFIVDYVNNEITMKKLLEVSTDECTLPNIDMLVSLKQTFNYYGCVDEVFFKLDDVVLQLIKSDSDYDIILEENGLLTIPVKNDDEYDYDDYNYSYDSAWFVKAINPPKLELFSEIVLDEVTIEKVYEEDDFTSTDGTAIVSIKDNKHQYFFAGQLNYDGEDCSSAIYSIQTEVLV